MAHKVMGAFLIVDDVDFVQVHETVTFNSGDTIACIDIIILNDILVEIDERFILVLTSVNADIGLRGTIITIIDNDEALGNYILILHLFSCYI